MSRDARTRRIGPAAIAAATLVVALGAPVLGQSPSSPSAVPAVSTAPVASRVPTAPSLTWTRLDELPGKPKGLVTTGAFGADGRLVLMGGMDPIWGPPVAWSSTDGTTWTPVKAGGPSVLAWGWKTDNVGSVVWLGTPAS